MASKIAVKALDHIVLTVRSVPATVAFYETLLGMKHEVFTSPKHGGVERHALVFGSQKINLHQAGREFEPKAQNVQPGSGDLCFLTDTPVDGVLKTFQEQKIEVGQVPSLTILSKEARDRSIICGGCERLGGGN
ncbi:MAG: hypothetical protein ALECFALPRED_004656 [Alectoria fallacina]|uniref:VOC domain-containing protein n=1 Tax=Alectoria fallacina TaxID=1903189 RepID=A0A8H3EMV7_9LECA|nr:MAG: hypothetical protein ALECFALPRED_004656 [Alectoria fallacina]